jgi:hypothetical protein
MSEPTPGPWSLDADDCSVHVGDLIIADCAWGNPEAALANARLIAAAPAMLAALRECAIRLRYDGDLFDNQQNELRRDASWRAMDLAKEAIAKATGDDS